MPASSPVLLERAVEGAQRTISAREPNANAISLYRHSCRFLCRFGGAHATDRQGRRCAEGCQGPLFDERLPGRDAAAISAPCDVGFALFLGRRPALAFIGATSKVADAGKVLKTMSDPGIATTTHAILLALTVVTGIVDAVSFLDGPRVHG